MIDLKLIGQGWFNYMKGSSFTKNLMTKRLAICEQCPHKKQLSGTGKVIVQAIHEEGSIYRCGLCNCPLATLTAAPGAGCKDKRWAPVGDESYF